MARKKILLFAVEGPSDQTALEAILESIFDATKIKVHVQYGDITSNSSTDLIQDRVKAAQKNFLVKHNSEGYKAKNIAKIIFLSDTDGCFIQEQDIQQDLDYKEKFFYDENCIKAADIERVKRRNQNKSKNMRILAGTQKVANKPFEYYYMSCNLDHVLYGKNNLTNEQKEEEADRFALQYAEDVDKFIDDILIAYRPKGVETYEESWKFIQEGLNSLTRHTNLIWFLEQNIEFLDPRIKEWIFL